MRWRAWRCKPTSDAVKSQKMVLEMLLSDMPDKGYKWNDAGTQTP
jgi:formate dehydrogenase major subunit